jgi:hypothetical protein
MFTPHSYLTVLFLLATLVSADGTFTITSLPAYTSQRVCAQNCFFGGYWNLPYALGCQSPYLDSCACRTDLTSSGSSILNSCINTACSSNSNDINSAESLYMGYCATVNGGPAATDATTTANGNSQAAGHEGSKTVTITATVVTTNGAVTTSPIAPLTTVVNQNDPNYNNVIEINGSGNTHNAGPRMFEVSTL